MCVCVCVCVCDTGQQKESREERKEWCCSVHTSDIIAQDPGRDDPSIGCEKGFQLLLRHRLRKSTHVQVGSFDGFARRTRERDLRPDNAAQKRRQAHEKKREEKEIIN